METRTYPAELLRLKRLLAKMYADDPERAYVTDLAERAEAGYKGETAVDNYLRGLRLPCKMAILRDIRLQIHEEYVAQFDTLLVTDRGIWIIEAKMIRGTLRLLDNPRRMEREDSGSVLTMECPILQLENQKTGLKWWLEERGLSMPVGGVVAFASRNTWAGLPEGAPIVSVKELKSWLKGSVTNSANPDSRYSPLEAVIDRLRAEELGPDIRPFEEMGIRTGPLKDGPICEKCFALLNRKGERSHECRTCKEKVKGDPIGRALLDHFLLNKPWITNREFCRLMGFQWLSTGRRYLARYDLDREGRVYRFDPKRHLEGKSLRKVERTEGPRHRSWKRDTQHQQRGTR